MLNVNTIKNGLVIDHIRAGSGWEIYQWLGLDKAPFTSCLIQNVSSEKSGKKDIIKIDNIINIDYSVLGFIDPDICVNVLCAKSTWSFQAACRAFSSARIRAALHRLSIT